MRWFTKIVKALKNEDGFLPLFFALMLPFIFFAWGLAIDFGRAHIAKEELQTAADAGSLAAAATATTVPASIEYQPITDSDGNVTGVQENVTKWKAEIQDEAAAQSAAQHLFQANAGNLSPGAGVDFNMSGDWNGAKVGDSSYDIKAGVRVKAPWAGAAAALLWGSKSYYKIPVSTMGTGQAFVNNN
ncbi:hypothetical protein A6M21_07560 [Desulfotomaculum copahuensis]|uniref:Putative Flp pilus-assembly TadG-like N-terminal domain-containing protein n=1 Tax=Desulfotomaculum copahuensis TaxID=1838280 RepID=A0A1B7LG35_9FIRM|nr:hypothetical protein A6M21_07560 [Desulfotomaculum copahuensis]